MGFISGDAILGRWAFAYADPSAWSPPHFVRLANFSAFKIKCQGLLSQKSFCGGVHGRWQVSASPPHQEAPSVTRCLDYLGRQSVLEVFRLLPVFRC